MDCSFCGRTLERGTGMIYVQTDGKVLYFCSRTCEKNMIKLKRKPRETRWTAAYRHEKQSGKKTSSKNEGKAGGKQ